MSNTISNLAVATVEATPKQRTKLYDLVRQDAWGGLTKAARTAGIKGTRRQLKDFLEADSEFQEVLKDARTANLGELDLGVNRLLTKLSWIVNDDGNSSQLRAIERAFQFHGIYFHERAQIEHTGEVRNPDVADAVDRFNALVSAAAVRLAAAGGAAEARVDADGREESRPRLPVAQLDRPA